MSSRLIKKVDLLDSTLSEVLLERLRALDVSATNRARAKFLETDPATLSKVLNGLLPFTIDRARRWAALLHPDSPNDAPAFAERLMLAANPPPPKLTVDGFCDDIVKEGGAVGAERISELFEALASDRIHNRLVLIEYRDTPRAGPDAKYQALGRVLGKAIARGVHVGMLIPFRTPALSDAADERVGASKAMKYMIDVHDACCQAYFAFRRFAEDELASRRDREIGDMLRMYVPGDYSPVTLTPGFQAKIFYIQYDESDGDSLIRHHRVLQWISAPPRDLLVYRGRHIEPEALRDSFFPIPHAFDVPTGSGEDLKCRLPHLPGGADGKTERDALEEALKARWGRGYGLPFGKSLWESYDAPA